MKNNNTQTAMIVVIVLLAIIYGLNLIDYFQTMYTVSIFGLGVEANPIARLMFENNCASIIKLVVAPIFLIIMGFIIYEDRTMIWVPYVLIVVYMATVINNFIVMVQLGII